MYIFRNSPCNTSPATQLARTLDFECGTCCFSSQDSQNLAPWPSIIGNTIASWLLRILLSSLLNMARAASPVELISEKSALQIFCVVYAAASWFWRNFVGGSCQIWMSHATHKWGLSRTRVSRHVRMRCVLYIWVLSRGDAVCHIRIRHVTYKWGVSDTNASSHVRMSHDLWGCYG